MCNISMKAKSQLFKEDFCKQFSVPFPFYIQFLVTKDREMFRKKDCRGAVAFEEHSQIHSRFSRK